MNMPEMDKYYTVQAHTILRQYLDYKHWYDRQKLTLRDIHNCQYVACMNPTAGNFTIDSRIQRHFAVFAVSFPGQVIIEYSFFFFLKNSFFFQGFITNNL
jgi:dynein heavy chain